MVANRRVVAIIQCRMSSTRLPGKALLDLGGKTLLARVIERTRAAHTLDDVWVATSTDSTDDIVVQAAGQLGAKVFRGPLDDVLARFQGATRAAHADVIVRVTGDNPLIEPRFIDLCVEELLARELDHVVVTPIPLGTGAEAVSRSALSAASEQAVNAYDREHVTPLIIKRPEQFKLARLANPYPALARPDIRVTLDTPADHARLSDIFRQFPNAAQPSLEDVIALHNGA
jgi:spore coat polysaccharide biosynthesis protein SpsF